MKAYPEYKASGIDWLGEIPSHWRMSKIKYEKTEFINGFAFDSEALDSDNDVPVIRIGDICNDINLSFCKKVKYNKELSSYLIKKQDILIAMSGATVGKSCFVNNNYYAYVNQRVGIIRGDINKFIFYHIISQPFLRHVELSCIGSAQPNISATQIMNFPFAVPPLDEQEAIAAYLDDVTGKIDTLISEKRKQVEDIRAYRTSLITETVTRGLNPDAPLRPSGIDWLGDIPKHWITSKLKYIGEARNGLTYSPDDICEQGKGVLVLRSSNIQNEQLCLEDNVYVSKKVDELMMNEGDILICSRNGSASLVGKCAIIPKGVNASFGAFMMRYRSIINKRFTLYLVRTTLAQHKAQFATSTINQLTNAMIGNMQVAVPPLAEQQAIADFLDAKTAKIDELISELTKQIDELTEYKQAVITEAVTGKVDVRDYKPSN